jgi:hypothetical protein
MVGVGVAEGEVALACAVGIPSSTVHARKCLI